MKMANRKRDPPVPPDVAAMNLGILRFDRTAPLIDGPVNVENVNVINVPGGKAGVQTLLSGALDAADIPCS